MPLAFLDTETRRINALFNFFFFLAVGFAFLDWASTWKGWKLRLYIAKPATLLFLILWTLRATAWQGEMLWFGLGLCFSLAGDVLLMLNARYFMIGVGAFLFAHIFYLVGFNQSAAPVSIGVMLIAILVGITTSRVYRLIKPGIMKVPRGKRFLTAVMVYGITLTFMLLSALLTLYRPTWNLSSAIFAAGGAILFYLSDTVLAYDRFVRKLNHGQSYVHLTYHLGQIGIITGALLHFFK
jgi:uncharacterized membrane protein YhhN